VIRYGPPDGEFVIDIVGRLGEAYAFADIDSDRVDIDGIPVPVATTSVVLRK
jgi:hypothetical protein